MNRGRDRPKGGNAMQELWKDIPGFEGRYKVSNTGEILSLNFKKTGKPKCLKPTPNEAGYLAVIFYIKSKAKRFFVHRLVADAFVDNPHGFQEVNHKDGNKANNSSDNLEWCTSSQNKAHGVHMGLYNGMVKTVIRQMKPMLATNIQTGQEHIFYSLRDAAEFTGGNTANISKVLHGDHKHKSCKGYTFKYIEGGEDLCRDLIISSLEQKRLKKGLFATSPLLQEQVC